MNSFEYTFPTSGKNIYFTRVVVILALLQHQTLHLQNTFSLKFFLLNERFFPSKFISKLSEAAILLSLTKKL